MAILLLAYQSPRLCGGQGVDALAESEVVRLREMEGCRDGDRRQGNHNVLGLLSGL